jgi:hypothetical protein
MRHHKTELGGLRERASFLNTEFASQLHRQNGPTGPFSSSLQLVAKRTSRSMAWWSALLDEEHFARWFDLGKSRKDALRREIAAKPGVIAAFLTRHREGAPHEGAGCRGLGLVVLCVERRRARPRHADFQLLLPCHGPVHAQQCGPRSATGMGAGSWSRAASPGSCRGRMAARAGQTYGTPIGSAFSMPPFDPVRANVFLCYSRLLVGATGSRGSRARQC